MRPGRAWGGSLVWQATVQETLVVSVPPCLAKWRDARRQRRQQGSSQRPQRRRPPTQEGEGGQPSVRGGGDHQLSSGRGHGAGAGAGTAVAAGQKLPL
jgi:hypothetical protein